MSNEQSHAQSTPRSASPADVLAVYAEPLVASRRVALVGVGDDPLVEVLLGLAPRLLYVYDPRPNVVASRAQGEGRVSILPLKSGDLGVRDGAFDLAIVPDLSLLGDREAALAHVRRLVGREGAALVASRNPDARRTWLPTHESSQPPTYTEFYDLCTLQFAEVRMLGAAPFAGYAVAEFAPDREPAIAFDASLVTEPEAPEWFVAIVAQTPVESLEAYQIVQVPCDAVDVGEAAKHKSSETSARLQLTLTEQKLHEAEARAGDQYVRAERLGNDLRALGEDARKLRERGTRLQKELEDERRLRTRLETELETARRAPPTDGLIVRIAALEAELIEARTQLATPRAGADEVPRLVQERERLLLEAATFRDRAIAAERATQPLLAELNEARRRLVERERELEASLIRAKRLEDRLAEQLAESSSREGDQQRLVALQRHAVASEEVLRRAQAELLAIEATHREDVAQLEAALRARGEELRTARAELARRDRLVRELVARVEESEAASNVAIPVPIVAREAEGGGEQVALARREFALLVEELRRRDATLAEAGAAIDTLSRELEAERAKTEQLARDAARREAALQTASWRITELEKLGGADEPSPEESDRRRLQAELDALRRALAQEHARSTDLARRLEVSPASGDGDLARAQAKLAEREALIAQLSAELAARRTLETPPIGEGG